MRKGIIFLVGISIFTFLACETDEVIERSYIEATVSGEPWFSYEPTALLSDSQFTLRALSHDGLTIEFTVGGVFIGGYNLKDTAQNEAKFTPNLSTQARKYSSSRNSPNGIIRITDIDTKNQLVSGTFFFKAWHPTDPIYEFISDGVFKQVPYSYMPTK
ncbi:MAG: DUF6252 family protein [Bacteroidota bacterium]|nr:DUF6252 family protein [Bacteroidota bacterium]